MKTSRIIGMRINNRKRISFEFVKTKTFLLLYTKQKAFLAFAYSMLTSKDIFFNLVAINTISSLIISELVC